MPKNNDKENVVPMLKPKSKPVKAKKKAKKAAPAKTSVKRKAVTPNVPGTTGVVKKSAPKLARKAVVKPKTIAKPKLAKKEMEKKSVKMLKSQISSLSKPKQSNILQYKTMEETMTQSTQQFDVYTKDAAEFGRQSMDAAKEASTIFTTGFEQIMKASMEMMQSAAEKQSNFMKEAMSSKTVNEFADLQSKMAQSSFDDFMEGATKISEMTVKVLGEASEPMNEQMNKAVNINKAA